MKTILSKINKVGLLAFVLGLMLIGTTSAFKGAESTVLNKRWGNLFVPASGMTPAHYIWVDLTGLTQGAEEDYDCLSSEEICTADFPEEVDPNDQANDTFPGTASPSNIDPGDFYLVEQ